METKVIVLGQEPKKELRKIEFIKCLCSDEVFRMSSRSPASYKNIELICENYLNWLDLMFAYDDCREHGVLYLGNFNDGVV